MRSRQLGLLVSIVLAQAPVLASDEPAAVRVTNFPETQRVYGEVSVGKPVPASRLLSFRAETVPPVKATDTTRLIDLGVEQIRVGIRSATRETFQHIHKKDLFDRVKANIERLLELKDEMLAQGSSSNGNGLRMFTIPTPAAPKPSCQLTLSPR